jgi:hypothetical protein
MASTEDLESSGDIVKLSTGTSFPVTRGLCVGTAGTATLTSEAGQTLTNYPLQLGYNPIKIKGITFGTASDIWALY